MNKMILNAISLALFATFLAACAAHSTKKKSLKQLASLSTYKLSDFNLPKPIKFFTMATYEYYENTGRAFIWNNVQDSPDPVATNGWQVSFSSVPHQELTPAENNLLSALKPSVPRHNKKQIIHYVARGFGVNIADKPHPRADILSYVAKDGQVAMVNSKAELKRFLGNIDTEAEVALMIRSEGLFDACYKKTANGYEVYAKPFYSSPYSKMMMDKKGNFGAQEELADKSSPCY